MNTFSLSSTGRKNIQQYLSAKGYKVSFENIYGDDEHIYLIFQEKSSPFKITKVRFSRNMFYYELTKFLKNNKLL